RVRITYPQTLGIPLELHPQPPQVRLDPAEVVGVVGTDPDLQQPAPLGRPQRQLLAALRGGQNQTATRPVTHSAQPVVLVIRCDRVDIRDTQGYRRQTM